MSKHLLIFLGIFITAIGSSWGACYSFSGFFYATSRPSCTTCGGLYTNCEEYCEDLTCPNPYYSSSRYYLIDESKSVSECLSNYSEYNCSVTTSFIKACYSNSYCTTKAEADSVACEFDGGIWDGSECQAGDTTSCDTYKKECEGAGGKFIGTPLGNGCNAICQLCDSPLFKEKIAAFGKSCCNQNLVPPDSSENLLCYDVITQAGQGMAESQSCLSDNSCVCGSPYNEETGAFNTILYGEKCGAVDGSDNPNSSGSGSGDESSSSSSDDTTSVPQVQVMGLEGLMDSLHKIIYNTAEVDTTTQYMLLCMQNPEIYCPSLVDRQDTTIINGDTIVVNVDIPNDSVLLQEIANNIASQGARTRNKLDTLVKELSEQINDNDSLKRGFDSTANYMRDSLLGILGAQQIVEGNETQALLDSVIGRLDGVIGELAGFGESLKFNLPDTSVDLGGKDTANQKGTIDSLASWVNSIGDVDSIGGWGKPNASGGYGDGSGYGYGVTEGSNDTAIISYSNTMRGLVDSGAVKNVLDTMQKWSEKFDFGAAASSGGCPSILIKTYEINIGAASFTMGEIGKYLCSPIAGINTTFWDIGRMILRAIVAIMCFLWLFKVSVSGGKEE